MKIVLMAFLLAFGIPSVANGQNRVYTPARGSVERNAMMDALRVPVMRAIGGPLIFTNVQIWAVDGWAFVQADPTSPRGEPLMDRYRARMGDDNFTDQVVGLLRWDGRRWVVVAVEIGPTEYPYRWQQQYTAPRRIYPWNQGR
jgi:hypothetical protein